MKHKIVGDIACMKCNLVLEYDLTFEEVNTIDLYAREEDAPIWCDVCEDQTTIRLADIRTSDDCTCSLCLFWKARDVLYRFLTGGCYVVAFWYILWTSQ